MKRETAAMNALRNAVRLTQGGAVVNERLKG